MYEDRGACEAVSELLPELALGVLTGRERAAALAHLETCPRCSAELEKLSVVADGLLEMVPGADPPIGFEVRVLERLQLERPAPRARLGYRRIAVAVLLTLAVGLGGFAIGTQVGAPKGPPQLALGNQGAWAKLDAARGGGEVLVFAGHPAWLIMVVKGMTQATWVHCAVTTKSGTTLDLGSFWLNRGSGTWSAPLHVLVSNVAMATLSSTSGELLASAILKN